MFRSVLRAFAPLALALSVAAAPAAAQTLRVALSSEPTALDPHYHDLTPNNALSAHVFDGLTGYDPQQRLIPALATEWTNDGANRWQFRLRQNVVFSNGQPFTAADAVFTFCRILNNETSIAGSFADPLKNVRSIETPDAHTLVVTTINPEPLLPAYLADIGIISQSVTPAARNLRFSPDGRCGFGGPWPTVSTMNELDNAVGTGPFRVKSYTRGAAIELVRNDRHWGERSAWAEVRFVPVPNAGPRLAGLLAGDYDVIENPAARDLGRLRGNPRFGVVVTPSTRIIYLQLDVEREPSPFVRAEGGKNPLRDLRVRQAINLAIDRNAIARRIMDEAAQPAAQYLPNGMFGALENPPAIPFDPARARALLAEAGYPNGFAITLHATNDRYINDGQIAQAIAQMLTQIGIRTEVDAMTRSIFFGRRARREFSVAMGGWGSGTGEASSFLRYWVATNDRAAGLGGSNYGGYSDPEFDRILKEAIATLDDGRRATLLQQAVTRAIERVPYIPIHFESSIWAHRAGLQVTGRTDQRTLATSVVPAR
jgi:peptide/nickel transport system substrate-binding protein